MNGAEYLIVAKKLTIKDFEKLYPQKKDVVDAICENAILYGHGFFVASPIGITSIEIEDIYKKEN